MSNSAIRDKLISLLAAGVPPSAAASAAGVEPSYVSQLLETEDFREALLVASSARLEEAIAHDKTVESLESKTLRAIEQKLPFVRSAMEAAKIFQILNNSKKRALTDRDANAGGGNVQLVTIVLPKAAAVNLRLNSQQQVIEVEGRTMAPLPSRELPKLQEADSKRAAEVLANVDPLKTTLNGVTLVL